MAVLAIACDDSRLIATTPPSGVPTASATDSQPSSPGRSGPIDHPTGSSDVVLRFELSGGFVVPGYLATQAPGFTLYGDGTVIFRDPNLDPPPAVGSVMPLRSFRIARLSEDQVQAVLADALGEGGLKAARTDYSDRQIYDLPTAVFTIDAGGINKRVAITGLGIDIGSTPDDLALAAFLALSARLEGIDSGAVLASDEYVPDRYRGSLLEGETPAPDVKAWPWTTIAPADFVTDPDPNGFPLPARVMSGAEVEAIGLKFPYAGGFQGLTLVGPGDGKTYTFALRPLLPDETK
jgi:hypothetical protein